MPEAENPSQRFGPGDTSVRRSMRSQDAPQPIETQEDQRPEFHPAGALPQPLPPESADRGCELDPVWWTPIERRIRCRPWTRGRGRSGHGGASPTEGLRARVRKRYRCTTMSDHDQPVAANLLDRRFEAERPNHEAHQPGNVLAADHDALGLQLGVHPRAPIGLAAALVRSADQRWVGDVTEILSGQGKLYLAVILDLFSRMVEGWALSAANDRHLALRALEHALRRRCPEGGLLHHTDQGSPYASEDYQRVLAAHGITCSMSRRGNAHDNAAMESWFSTMTFELGDRFDTHAEAKTKLFDYIEVFYNQERRQP